MQPHPPRRGAKVAFLFLTLSISSVALAQDRHASMKPKMAENGASKASNASFVDQIAELRAKVARLEAALEQDHQGASPLGDASSRQRGRAEHRGASMSMDGMTQMGGSGMKSGVGMMKMDKMGGGGMSGKSDGSESSSGMSMMGKGMKMMGMMKGMGETQGMVMQSALPGFPGASHLYHIGATGFFLDHADHVQLTTEQQSKLNQIKEKVSLEQATADRRIEEAEQQLWQATAKDQPDANAIEAKIREIEKLRGDQRLAFIRAVGEATKVLTHEQHQTLTGAHSDSASPADHTGHNP